MAADKTQKASRLSYPKDTLYEQTTDYMLFTFLNYVPPFGAGTYQNSKNSSSLSYYNSSGNKTFQEDTSLSSILLYMPEDVQTATSAQWGEKSFTNTGRDLLAAGGKLLNGQPGQAIQDLVGTFSSSAGRLPSLAAAGLAAGINSLPGGVGGNVGLNDVLSGTKGIVLNPNVELLFQGYGLREFDVNFKFTPRSEAEAEEIRKICNTFRKASLPKFGAKGPGAEKITGQKKQSSNRKGAAPSGPKPKPNPPGKNINDNYISVPNLVKVRFMKGSSDHPYLPQYKECAITDVAVNYTPDGSYATYSDGSPVATGLSLKFTETKLVFSDEIEIDGGGY